ncbi:hypothetical protein POSPLADRAFT_1059011 [Postia placenta MAD-698-R-SB12]|uniref:Uncharacterized protein n=1 Tax=Postia placenta MAD-698-R-SB12 TaxID=670580 RepID=A0A1X6MU17_9APHY|nr:hypothetical protein POSPLADRAFT_1059011 [Postia placenta MAD-698-R-SB12]OSX59712.1 hypothetical protein POSPLADRAFT_1059011 [Postia placenta MAD-698-R-SB12]
MQRRKPVASAGPAALESNNAHRVYNVRASRAYLTDARPPHSVGDNETLWKQGLPENNSTPPMVRPHHARPIVSPARVLSTPVSQKSSTRRPQEHGDAPPRPAPSRPVLRRMGGDGFVATRHSCKAREPSCPQADGTPLIDRRTATPPRPSASPWGRPRAPTGTGTNVEMRSPWRQFMIAARAAPSPLVPSARHPSDHHGSAGQPREARADRARIWGMRGGGGISTTARHAVRQIHVGSPPSWGTAHIGNAGSCAFPGGRAVTRYMDIRRADRRGCRTGAPRPQRLR